MKIALVLMLFLISTIAHAFEKPPIPLTLHERHTLQYEKPIRKFSIDGRCVHALPLPAQQRKLNELLLQADHVGTCHLQVWFDSQSEIRTLHVRTHSSDFPALWQALAQLHEAQVFLSGKTWTIQGLIADPQEALKIAQITADYPQETRDLSTLSPELVQHFRKSIENWIARNQLASLRIELIGQSLRLTGTIADATTQAELERQARTLAPKIDIRLQTLPSTDPTVYFKVTLLELSKQDAESLGIQWTTESTPLAVYSSTGLQSALQIELALQALATKGNARVLSRPEIALKIPGEAEFMSGGEFAVVIKTAQGKWLAHWKQYGLMLHIKTTHTTETQVRLDINVESSQVHKNSVSQNDVPSLQTHRMKTQVDATYEQPLFLSGLYQNIQQEQTQGIPFLSQIPLIGRLFGTHSQSERQTELIAILIPQKKPSPPRTLLEQIKPESTP